MTFVGLRGANPVYAPDIRRVTLREPTCNYFVIPAKAGIQTLKF